MRVKSFMSIKFPTDHHCMRAKLQGLLSLLTLLTPFIPLAVALLDSDSGNFI